MGGQEKLLLVKQNNFQSGILFVVNVCDGNYRIPSLFQTNDVNQGDALEHDFSSLHLALTFPFKHLLDANFPQVHVVKCPGNLLVSFLMKSYLFIIRSKLC